MSYTPVVPLPGLAGWQFLRRTSESQMEAFARSPVQQREIAYFRENITSVSSAADLVADRTLLKVALGAFGLDEDLPNKFFLRKVLEEGTTDPEALANRLADKRYLAFSKSFGFGDPGGKLTADPGFADRITASFRTRAFEIAVGEVNPDMRLAMGLERELADLLAPGRTADSAWFSVMATPPLRTVFETAFGLPDSFAALDLDQQLKVFRDRAERYFGVSEVAEIAASEQLDAFRQQFLVRSGAEIQNAQTSPALSILSGAGSASGILAALYAG